MAQTTTSTGSPSTTATSSYDVFSAIASSNGNSGNFGIQPGNVASDPTSQAGQNAAGASGSSDGSVNLSTGVTVAIIIVVCLVVLIGAGSAILFYLAKKRQWAIRDSLRRSVRRVTGRGRDRPKTPRTGDTVRSKSRNVVRIDPPSSSTRAQRSEEEKTPILEDEKRKRDVEKGFKSYKQVAQVTPGLQSSFDMDSPRNAHGAGWSKMFGKK